MAFALRCLFFLLALITLGVLLYLYRRKVNVLLLALVAAYTIAIGARLVRTEADDELVWQSIAAVAGLGLLWLGIWAGERWLRSRDQDGG